MERFFLWVNKRGTLSVKSGRVYKRVRGDEDECGTFLNIFTVKVVACLFVCQVSFGGGGGFRVIT